MFVYQQKSFDPRNKIFTFFQFSPVKKFLYSLWEAVLICECVPEVHDITDQVDLGDDGLSSGNCHQGIDVTDSQTDQEVHDDNGEQDGVGSKEEMCSTFKIYMKYQ